MRRVDVTKCNTFSSNLFNRSKIRINVRVVVSIGYFVFENVAGHCGTLRVVGGGKSESVFWIEVSTRQLTVIITES